jgi:hypothetical protein
VTDVMVLASFRMIFLGSVPVATDIQVGPTTPSSLPGHPAIAGGDPLQILPLAFCGAEPDEHGWSVPGVGALAPSGGCGTVAVVGATWGSIKALYRDGQEGR